MTEQQPLLQQQSDENSVDITLHDIIQMMLVNWYWFLLSIALCVGVAYYYLASTPKIYNRTAMILVKDSHKGGDTDLAAFSDLAGFQTRRSVDNEVYILQSRRMMTEVVKRLNLTISYSVRERLRNVDLYGVSPLEVSFINDNDSQSVSLDVTPLNNEQFQLTQFIEYFGSDEHDYNHRSITAQYGDTITTPIGRVVVKPSLYMSSEYTGTPILVKKSTLRATTNAYQAATKSSVTNKQASVVSISMNNSNAKRAEDIINTLIEVYNEDAIEDKRQISVTTENFIKARLSVIGKELGGVDRDIENIKTDNQMVDLVSEATRSVSESSQYKAQSLSLENQMQVGEFIRSYLNEPANAAELIPMMASIANKEISSQISEYNQAILRREKLLENSSANSPVIQDLDNMLAAVRRSIIASLDSHISTLNIQLRSLRKEESLANNRIATIPAQENVIQGIMRQQKIKEELFLYLLNKQEETQLNYVLAESNSRVIDPAHGDSAPVSPQTMIVLGIALFAGLALPFGIIFLLGMLDTTVHSRREIEKGVGAPFLGDIPFSESETTNGILVRETGRDALSEGFRILRSNMAFMNVSAGSELKCVLFTSSTPHAGKTFVATNLAMTFAMAGKRVLLIDLDLRRHALSSQLRQGSSKKGMTNYLAGSIGMEEIISRSSLHENLDVIYSGVQPPNPTEMLLSERLDKLVAELRTRYDYIFMDSTPAMTVADAIITDRLCDLAIYVVREGVLDRRQLPDIDRLYREKKLHNMSLILNATRSGRHGYGYGYGYGYGSGYGYGYGYGDQDQERIKEPSYRKRIIKFLRRLLRINY